MAMFTCIRVEFATDSLNKPWTEAQHKTTTVGKILFNDIIFGTLTAKAKY